MLYERVLERNDIQTVDICNLEIFAMYCSQELVKVSIKCNEWLNSWGSGQVDQYDSNQHIIRDILEYVYISALLIFMFTIIQAGKRLSRYAVRY